MDTVPGPDTMAGTDEALTPQDVTNSTLCVRVLASPDRDAVGRTVAITERGLLAGRATGASDGKDTLHLADGRMSRRHAYFVRAATDAPVSIEDLGSKNGTMVNGRPVASAQISVCDMVRTGDSLLVVCPPLLPASDARTDLTGLVGVSAAIRDVRERIGRMADAELAVLLLGETGTGKEVVANALHRLSGLAGPFVPLNATAIPKDLVESELFGAREGAYSGAKRSRKGYFLEAHRGTLFLDEIGDMPASAQSKLLRALEAGEVIPLGATQGISVDVRVVSATNADIDADATAGRFRLDLLFRLAQLRIELPPLRARREDIPVLWDHFTDHSFADLDDASVQEALLCYRWPGNVRELRNVARAVAVESGGEPVSIHRLPDQIRFPYLEIRSQSTPAEGQGSMRPDPTPPATSLPPGGRPTREQLVAALRAHAGNIAAVGRHFGRQRPQVYRWLKRYQIDVDETLGS